MNNQHMYSETKATKKVLVIGATGTIGAAVVHALEEKNYEVITASRNGEFQVDLENLSTINKLFVLVGKIDAVVVTAGSGKLIPFSILSEDDFIDGLKDKVLGQVALVLRAVDHLNDGGSITITSGNMFENFIPGSSVGAFVNNGLDGFVRAVAPELPRGIRVNIISPGWVRESLERMNSEERTTLGLENVTGTAAYDVAQSYVQAIEGTMQGQTIRPLNQLEDELFK
ncbi:MULTISPECIES: short chain dehydrogenase [Paenibacillus]|uniref:short chain dehydrogenase n=1 Tax=Paenibacillus TaxID=44249 RepID=UPI000E372904|nr:MULTISPECIES: short chain dehydrogenase [Paenibacillus]MCM2998537.1 short chain dehydrogenase [Paenibacillus cellulositrophicus]RED40264.1 NAD(P)-dependent dehydrogenase (short-subunit alcohol dehydrogenase family) [Paenibacillus sp. VMFN-D1]